MITDELIGSGTQTNGPKTQKRVAAYCRVSSLTDMQEDSLENQIIHYTNYIRANPCWQFAGIYSDRGKTGTKMSSRSGFMRLIRACQHGKVDVILCKSVSRFARNVMDTLNTVRELASLKVRVIFEKENLDTASMQSEFILTLLAAVAQEESRSISDNMTWSYTKRYEQGRPVFNRLLGYRLDENGNWVIIESEAAIVREAFRYVLEGIAIPQIARLFMEKGYKKVNGRTDWSGAAVRDIIQNERYPGDALCQKKHTPDYLTHKRIRNHGAVRQYIVRNHHEPIIDRDTFAKAQEVLRKWSKRSAKGNHPSYPLSGRITCGICGGTCQRFIIGETVRWRCGRRVKSKSLCTLESVFEHRLRKALIQAFIQRYGLAKRKSNPITAMVRDLENAEVQGDMEYNRLKLELERLLFEENMLILKASKKGTSPAPDAVHERELEVLRIRRQEIEARIQEREAWWELLDRDHRYRAKALSILEPLLRASEPLKYLHPYIDDQGNDLEGNERCMEFLRAWVTRITASSPATFTVKWLDGTESYIKEDSTNE